MTLDPQMREQRRLRMPAIIAASIRDGLLLALILHAVLTVLMSPRRNR